METTRAPSFEPSWPGYACAQPERDFCGNLWNISPGGWLECILPKGHGLHHDYPPFSAFYQHPEHPDGPFSWVYGETPGWTRREDPQRKLEAFA